MSSIILLSLLGRLRPSLSLTSRSRSCTPSRVAAEYGPFYVTNLLNLLPQRRPPSLVF